MGKRRSTRNRRQQQQRARVRTQSGGSRPGPTTPVRAQTPGRRRRSIGPLEIGAAVVVVAIIAILVVTFVMGTSGKTQPKAAGQTPGVRSTTPAGTPAPTAAPAGATVDGVQCQSTEQLVYHIHQYLRIYDAGTRVLVPPYIGIPGGTNAPCIYWIHTHSLADYPSGVIHVESPTHRTYTLGQFFDIWQQTQPQSRSIITNLASAAAKGSPPLTVYVNGRRYHRSYRSVPLVDHETIYIELGHPLVKPQAFDFAKYQL